MPNDIIGRKNNSHYSLINAPAAFKKAIAKLIYLINAQTNIINNIAITNAVH